jgi:hypothetical protein
VTHFGRAISEAEGLADVNVLLYGGVEKLSVDVELTHFKVTGGGDGKKVAEAGHADDGEKYFRVVESSSLAATLGDEPGFEAGDIVESVLLDLVDPHNVDYNASGGKVDEFPSAVVHERGVLMLHGCLPIWGLGGG